MQRVGRFYLQSIQALYLAYVTLNVRLNVRRIKSFGRRRPVVKAWKKTLIDVLKRVLQVVGRTLEFLYRKRRKVKKGCAPGQRLGHFFQQQKVLRTGQDHLVIAARFVYMHLDMGKEFG